MSYDFKIVRLNNKWYRQSALTYTKSIKKILMIKKHTNFYYLIKKLYILKVVHLYFFKLILVLTLWKIGITL